ncbi:MAG: response regulator transcription factor, partial [Steroidobacteraceae bacterium]
MALASPKAQPLTNGKLKLMICDDSNIIRRKIERELQIDRLQVTATAANGKQAVEAFRKEPADVVTMDLT